MTAYEAFEHYSQLEAKCAAQEELLSHSADVRRFDSIGMTIKEAARYLDMRPSTARDYAKRGLLILHPDSTDAKIVVKASDVLSKTKDQLRRAKRRLKWNIKDRQI